MSTPAIDFEELARAQRVRAAVLTQLDTWQTAAWMTCLLPFGLLFGVPALLVLRSKRAAVQDGRLDSVGRSLAVARGFVLGGAACAALAVLATLFNFTTELDAFAVAMTLASRAD